MNVFFRYVPLDRLYHLIVTSCSDFVCMVELLLIDTAVLTMVDLTLIPLLVNNRHDFLVVVVCYPL